MGSSKIMPSSLDNSVFDGVAREESVQSVLEAVSDSGQDGMNMIFYGSNPVGNVATASDVEILRIDGKASLKYFYIRTKFWNPESGAMVPQDAFCEIKVVCDGKLVTRAKFINTNGSVTGYRGYGANFVFLSDSKYTNVAHTSYSYVTNTSLLAFNQLGYHTSHAHFRPLNPDGFDLPMSITDNSGMAKDSVIFISDRNTLGKIEFNNSLVIYYSHSLGKTPTNGDISCEFGYKWEE